MRKKNLLYVFVIAFIFCGIGPRAKAQQTSSSAQGDRSAQKPQVNSYRLDFSINEMENGKKINERRYWMNTSDEGKAKEIKIGTRVPIDAGDGKFEYLDVGTSITAQIVAWQSPLQLDVVVDISNFANPDDAGRGSRPLLRQMQISARSPVILGKSVVVGSVDDPNSNHEFQLEVTVTKLQS